MQYILTPHFLLATSNAHIVNPIIAPTHKHIKYIILIHLPYFLKTSQAVKQIPIMVIINPNKPAKLLPTSIISSPSLNIE